MSGTKFNVKYKDLKTEVETDLEGLQELPIKFKQLSTNAPKTLGVYVTENSTVLTNLDDNDKLLDSVVTPASLVYARVDSENVTNGAVDLHASSTIHTSYLSINKGNNDPYALMGVNGDTEGATSIKVQKQEFLVDCSDGSSNSTTLKVVPTGITVAGDITATDATATNVTATDVTATNVTATNVTATNVTASGDLKASTLSPETGNQIIVTNLNEGLGGDIHLSLIDGLHATAKINLLEGDLSTGFVYGGRLSYSGSDEAPSGNNSGDNVVALSSITNSSGTILQKDILSYTYQGKDVRLTGHGNSDAALPYGIVLDTDEDDCGIQIKSQGAGSNIELEAKNDVIIKSTHATGTGTITLDSDYLKIPDIKSADFISNDNVTQYFLGIEADYVKRDTSSMFSQGHIYKTPVSIEPGTAVCLASGVVSPSNSPTSTTVVGIVARHQECTAENPVDTSLGETVSEGFVVKVVSVGDTNFMECTGFHVCNENGAVAPGDLLVTSSKAGYLMRQQDDIIRASTVGKAMDTAVFDGEGNATGVYGFLYCG